MTDPFMSKLLNCVAGDTIKMIVETSPLLPPHMLFRYVEFKVKEHRTEVRNTHEIDFEPFQRDNKDYRQLSITYVSDTCTIILFQGSKSIDWWSVDKLYDASKVDLKTIQEIEAESEQLVYAFKQRASVVHRESARIYDAHLLDRIYSVGRNLFSFNDASHEPFHYSLDQLNRFVKKLREKLETKLSKAREQFNHPVFEPLVSQPTQHTQELGKFQKNGVITRLDLMTGKEGDVRHQVTIAPVDGQHVVHTVVHEASGAFHENVSTLAEKQVEWEKIILDFTS